ncbi:MULTISPECIES: hypothetical protein [Sphingobium]|uniref:Uncharacterized protein n=1 Tax=Sphingobium lignivorans TaxID=2735886 RepID=A0ABR6NK53_9SPHN|nr:MULTISPECIES: hypothetical protein [Sphingobium]MBB5987660.1 hypothetical protein [Sphingobium lignivorans]BAK68293.1 hypothetical protein SLG_36180 [Sphingobium sp. SYK-6]
MTRFVNNYSNSVFATLLTIVFSATMVLGAVGPAYTGPQADQQIAAANHDNGSGKSA